MIKVVSPIINKFFYFSKSCIDSWMKFWYVDMTKKIAITLNLTKIPMKKNRNEIFFIDDGTYNFDHIKDPFKEWFYIYLLDRKGLYLKYH